MIECAPVASVETVSVASPQPSSAAVPRQVVPSKNCTFPVGVTQPGPAATTLASRVTGAPGATVFVGESSSIAVATAVTGSESGSVVLALKLPSPW